MSDRVRKYVTEAALTIGALAGLLCVITAIASVTFGLSPLVFRSDSMSPAIDVGDVAISRSVPATDVSAGDIVSVSRPDGTRITHRVVSIDSVVGNSTTMTLRGDANSINDPEPYTVKTVDRVLFHIPELGYVLSWFANPYTWAIAALLTLGLLWATFRPEHLPHKTNPSDRAAPSSTRTRNAAIALQAVVLATVVATAVTGYARTHSTLAALTDSATATGAVSTSRPQAPTSLTCTNVYPNIRLSWPNPVAHHSYDYELAITNVVGGTTRTYVKAASTATTATQTITYRDPWFPLAAIYNIELYSKVGNFLSTGKMTIRIQEAFLTTTCGQSSGTPSGAVAARSAPAPTTTTTSQMPTTTPAQAPPTTTSDSPTPSTPTTPTTTTAPTSEPPPADPVPSPAPPAEPQQTAVPDATSPNGTYIASVNDGVVVIGDTATGAEEYRATINAVAIKWIDDTTLTITTTDGTETTVTRTDDQWTTR